MKVHFIQGTYIHTLWDVLSGRMFCDVSLCIHLVLIWIIFHSGCSMLNYNIIEFKMPPN